MDITLITSLVFKNNRFEIGHGNDLLYHVKQDLKNFRILTTGHTIVMGYNTWLSLPYKPLKDRKNIVIVNRFVSSEKYKDVEFMTLRQFKNSKNKGKICLIGGAKTFELFLQDEVVRPKKMVLTHIIPEISIPADTFINPDLFSSYNVTGYSEIMKGENLKYRYIYYSLGHKRHQEYKYMELANDILNYGNTRSDRTGTGTVSLLGTQLRFNISNSFPLLTTKRVPFKAIVEELLFFCRGDTDSKILDERGVKIWNANTSREFLDNRGLNYQEGIMGPMYGHFFRHFGAKYDEEFADTSICNTSKIGGFDQLTHVEHLLKTDPFSRRIYISNLNPAESSKMVLEPCHTYIQFYVTEDNGEKHLSAYFSMRSSDYFLAAGGFNTPSYALLVYILALKCGMKPKEIIYNAVDCHIYKNHITQIKEQMTRVPRPFPCLELDESIKTKDWSNIKYEDFNLIGYFPHPTIKAHMAV
jgi:thymidylate synthase